MSDQTKDWSKNLTEEQLQRAYEIGGKDHLQLTREFFSSKRQAGLFARQIYPIVFVNRAPQSIVELQFQNAQDLEAHINSFSCQHQTSRRLVMPTIRHHRTADFIQSQHPIVGLTSETLQAALKNDFVATFVVSEIMPQCDNKAVPVHIGAVVAPSVDSEQVAKTCLCCGTLDAAKRCSRCEAPYCEIKCQRQHWKVHKLFCKLKTS